MQATKFESANRRSTASAKRNTFFRKLTMLYILVVLPGVLIYFILLWLTDLHGRQLFNTFLPSALVFVILYILYLAWPLLDPSGKQDHDDALDREDENFKDKKH